MTVRVAPCGAGYCATVIDAIAKAKATAARAAPPNLIGTQVMSDFRPAGDGIYAAARSTPSATSAPRDDPDDRRFDPGGEGLPDQRDHLQGTALEEGRLNRD